MPIAQRLPLIEVMRVMLLFVIFFRYYACRCCLLIIIYYPLMFIIFDKRHDITHDAARCYDTSDVAMRADVRCDVDKDAAA